MVEERVSHPHPFPLPIKGEGEEDILRGAIADLSTKLREQTKDSVDLHGMFSTAVLAQVRGRSLSVVHAGDSRAYLLEKGKLSQLTRDYSIVAVTVELG